MEDILKILRLRRRGIKIIGFRSNGIESYISIYDASGLHEASGSQGCSTFYVYLYW